MSSQSRPSGEGGGDAARPSPAPGASGTGPAARVVRPLWMALGLAFVGRAFVGALLPLLPTTIFLILAAGCFARSSPRLEAWLLNHARFGATLRAAGADGAISRRAQALAWG